MYPDRGANGALCFLLVIMVLCTLALGALVVNLYYPGLIPYLPEARVVHGDEAQYAHTYGDITSGTTATPPAPEVTMPQETAIVPASPAPQEQTSGSGMNALLIGKRSADSGEATFHLIGGLNGGEPVRVEELPITIGEELVTDANRYTFNKESASPVCALDLLRKDDRVKLYSKDAALEEVSVGELTYYASEKKKQTLISTKAAVPVGEGSILALSAPHMALPRIATESKDGYKRVFTVDIDDNGTPDTVTYAVADDKYSVVVNLNGKEHSLAEGGMAASKNKLAGVWFLDIDGDNRLELIEQYEGPSGVVSVFALREDGAQRALTLNLPSEAK